MKYFFHISSKLVSSINMQSNYVFSPYEWNKFYVHIPSIMISKKYHISHLWVLTISRLTHMICIFNSSIAWIESLSKTRILCVNSLKLELVLNVMSTKGDMDIYTFIWAISLCPLLNLIAHIFHEIINTSTEFCNL